MDKFILILIIISLIIALIVWFVDFLFKIKIIKYIISGIFLILTIYFFIIAKTTPKEGFNDLANFLMAFITFIAFLASLITSIVIDIIKNKKLKIVD